jgi:hypothetical protein
MERERESVSERERARARGNRKFAYSDKLLATGESQ